MLTPTVVELAQRFASRSTTVEAVARACIERIEARDPAVRAWVHLDPEAVLAGARELDRAGLPRAARCSGSRSASRTSSTRTTCPRRTGRRSTPGTARRPMLRASPSPAGAGCFRSGSSSRRSSPPGHPVRRRIRTTGRARRVDRRPARRRRSRQGWCPSRSRRRRPARSSGRQRSAGSSATSRASGRCRASVQRRSRSRSTRWG